MSCYFNYDYNNGKFQCFTLMKIVTAKKNQKLFLIKISNEVNRSKSQNFRRTRYRNQFQNKAINGFFLKHGSPICLSCHLRVKRRRTRVRGTKSGPEHNLEHLGTRDEERKRGVEEEILEVIDW